MKETIVLILNWNDSLRTVNLVRQLVNLEYDCDILVIDNFSCSREREILKSLQIEYKAPILHSAEECERSPIVTVRILLLPENFGYAKGNNIGLKIAMKSNYKYALVSNSDISLESEVLSSLIRCMETSSNVAVVGPKVVTPSGIVNCPRRIPGAYESIVRPMFYPFVRIVERIIRTDSRPRIPSLCWVSGSFMLMSIEKVSRVGFFDENTFLYMEEPILAERLKGQDLAMKYCDEVSVNHEFGASTRKLDNPSETLRIQIVSEDYFLTNYRNFGKFLIATVRVSRFLYFGVWSPIIMWSRSRFFKRKRNVIG
jgi:hypothetical protein